MLEEKLENDELEHVIPLKDYIYQKLIKNSSPFSQISPVRIFCIKITLAIIFAIEKIIGVRLFIKNELRELFFIDSRIRTALSFLIHKKIISTWSSVPLRPDQPPVHYFRLGLNEIILNNGKKITIRGSQGDGVGESVASALIPAIAEAVERYSISVWSGDDIVRGSYNSLRKYRRVDPLLFNYFSHTQRKDIFFKKSILNHDTEMSWINSVSFINKEECLVPSQLVYLSNNTVYGNDPFFYSVSTSGAAAGSSYESAVYSAICELVERDGLMIFWLNKIAPPVIDLESIPFPKVRKLINDMKIYNLELTILDITTDLQIPSFCAVMIDRYGGRAVSISAVAGYDLEKELEKLMYEIIKFAHELNKDNDNIFIKDYKNITDFGSRRKLWMHKEMIPEISFFINGNVVKLSDRYSLAEKFNLKEKLQCVRDVFLEKGYTCHVIDVTTDEAKALKLHVVRALIPQLMPVYFNEKEKCLGVARLYTVPAYFGYSKSHEELLNVTPHPFL